MRAHSIVRSALTAVVVFLVAILALFAYFRPPVSDLLKGVIQPKIVPSASAKGTRVVEREFAFEDLRVKLSVPVDASVYEGAANAEKSAIFIGGKRPPDWVAGYYRAFIDEAHQEAFYTSLLGSLHTIRDQQGLDSARYVELVTAMAQQLEYRVDPGNLAPKFSIETFADGYGDCDDKTLLAAGILSRDGYDVSVLFFAPEKHVALGVRAPGMDYKGTGYAYVEMTEPLLVGVPPESLSGGVKLVSRPTVIVIGDGRASYSAAEQILYIQKRLAGIEAERAKLEKTIVGYNAEATRMKSDLADAKSRLYSSGAVTSESAVREYNAKVDEYNRLVRTLNGAVARYNVLVEVQRYAAEHQTARHQVYARLAAF